MSAKTAHRRNKSRPIAERLTDYVANPVTGCWEWTNYLKSDGYGAFFITKDRKRKQVLAHRASYELHVGPLNPGEVVCHKCDNPKCIKPEHLFSGSHADNLRDMWSKGRCSHAGEKNAAAKLSSAQVLEIRTSNSPRKELSLRYGVSLSTITSIQLKLTWRSLEEPKEPK
jgi:hypothetical protein